MLAKIEAILDSAPFQIGFAIWTGIYLIQIYKGQITLKNGSIWTWIVGAMVVGLIIL